MITLRDEVLRALGQIEKTLLDVARWSWVNATLVRADPSLVLPSPALGLLQVVSDTSGPLPARGFFRSLTPVRGIPDMAFAPIAPGLCVHPWRVRATSWIDADASCKRGVRVVMDRALGSAAGAGTMTFAVRSAGSMTSVFARARAVVDGQPLPCAPVALSSADASALRDDAVHHRVSALFGALSRVALPESWNDRPEVEFDLVFERPVCVPPGTPCSKVVANVVPVWNSVSLRYPPFEKVSQYVSEAETRSVHPLDTRELGDHWRAWSIVRVGASGDPRIRFTPSGGPLSDDDPDTACGRYDLSFCPSRLAVILSSEARLRLDEIGEHLSVEFRATLGSRANSAPSGTEFQFVDPAALGPDVRITGTLVGPTWGGGDGVTPDEFAVSDGDLITSLVPAGHERSIDDVTSAVRVAFGGVLCLVDGRDLLYTEDGRTIAPLKVRVRFLQNGLPVDERRMLLRACQDFLDRYLVANPVRALELVESSGDA